MHHRLSVHCGARNPLGSVSSRMWMVAAVVCCASVVSAQFNVGRDNPPKPLGKYRTSYEGSKSRNNWADQTSGDRRTQFEEDYGLVHSFDANTSLITIDNARDESRVKTVWMQLQFAPSGRYAANEHGTPFNPAVWAVLESADGGGDVITPTSASWQWNGRALILWQTWTINPQPSGETIDISNIVQNARGPLRHVKTWTGCNVVPAPSSLALAGLGFLAVFRRGSRG